MPEKELGWTGPNYLKDYGASRRLANKIKEYYRYSKRYKDIDVRVNYNFSGDYYYITSNIAQLMPGIAELEDRLK